MEVKDLVKTVNHNETGSCLSTDFYSDEDDSKQILEEVDQITSLGHLDSTRSTTISAQPLEKSSRSKRKRSKISQLPKAQLISDFKTFSEKCESKLTRLLDSDSKETIDETDQFDDLHGSSNADVSSNEDSSEIPPAEVLDDSSNYDSRRTRRKSKRKLDGDFLCPVCGLTVREPELTSHYAQEVEKLTKITGNMMKLRSRKSDGINTTYVQVKSNRENRLTAKVAQYASKASKEIQCFICKLRLSGSEEDVNKHVLQCVQNADDYDEHIVVDDDEDDESFEEYEIGDQTRIRTISLVSGGYRSLEGPTSKRNRCDESEDVDIDVDDSMGMAYGEPQYTENDVIPHSCDGDSDELRKAVLGNRLTQPVVIESRKWGDIADAKIFGDVKMYTDISGDFPVDVPISDGPLPTNRILPTSDTGESSNEHKTNENELKNNENELKDRMAAVDQTVNSLKERMKDLEDQNKNLKCLICLESYTKPVVSTTCWHVHCEECWLMTMGVKKLCPQCNMIVFPSDLRKIYL